MQRTQQILFGLLILSVLSIAVVAARYLSFEVVGLLNDKDPALLRQMSYRTGFYTHISLGILALLLGPVQFIPRLRARNLRLHRSLGKMYVACCLISGMAGLYIAQYASAGMITRIGFSGLAIAWLISTSTAFRKIRQGNVPAHQIWMYRSYALTLAAVTLRMYLGPMMAFGVDFYVAYKIVAWACWIPNLILVELLWISKLRKGLTASPGT